QYLLTNILYMLLWTLTPIQFKGRRQHPNQNKTNMIGRKKGVKKDIKCLSSLKRERKAIEAT
ncbi:MAG: hypothetical protein PHI66_04225, partial [Candidatus Pacebacteria bacterium]|nr:hypothetical protein [Candidatus Paceibacterota bacterium]